MDSPQWIPFFQAAGRLFEMPATPNVSACRERMATGEYAL